MTRPMAVILLGVWLTLVSAVTSQVEPTEALLLEKHGALKPDLPTFGEIPPGTLLSLSDTAWIKFSHYRTCQEVTITGGSIKFGSGSYEVTGGTLMERHGKCPERYLVDDTGGVMWVSGSVMLRSLHREEPGSLSPRRFLTVPLRPTLVLVGKRARDFSSVRVSKAGKQVLHVPLVGPALTWPAVADPLVDKGFYEMTLYPSQVEPPPVKLKLYSTSAKPKGTIVLVHIE